MEKHKEVRIEYGEESATVDEGIAPLVLAIWQVGLRTISSCEDHDGTGWAWVGFPTIHEAERFQRLVGREGRLIIPTDADYTRASDASREAGFSVRGSAGVLFLRSAIPTVLKRCTDTARHWRGGRDGDPLTRSDRVSPGDARAQQGTRGRVSARRGDGPGSADVPESPADLENGGA